ncbi:PorP/SprF family type IX secretion system membrane protein [Aquimarina sp. 2304DJ70-9]|uniref:PorP/SprF family type IX secretion system membrane protein n=1 Tax=Aquimarina penaris TaxID=3231044 RepID=UPI003463216C
MKNLKTIFFVLALSFVVQATAQQDPHFSLYKYNMNIISPAYAGTNGSLEAMFGVRSQWVGIPDGPEILNFNINSPIGKNVGVGLSIVNDQVFVLEETHLYADFSYKIQVGNDLNLYAGVKAGGTFLNVDLNALDIDDDPLFAENVSNFNPNIGVGFYLKAPQYYVTVSAPSLLKNDRFEREGVVPVSASDDVSFFLGGGGDFVISRSLDNTFKLRPSTLIRAVNGSPISIDLTASGVFNDRFELGANYRLDESVTFFITAGFIDSVLHFGYAYEYTTTDVGTYNNGTHEIIMKLKLK